jgi:hypothetical protein
VKGLQNVETVVPRTVPQFHRLGDVGEFRQYRPQSTLIRVAKMKARWELKQQTTQLSAFNQRNQALPEFSNICIRPRVFSVREQLPGFQCKFKVVRGSIHPTFGGFGGARAIKR